MSDTPNGEVEHTLMFVEADGLNGPDVYQVTQVKHPPDSKQVKAVEAAMRQLVEEVEEETGRPHRFVKETDAPGVVEMHYKMHQADGGEHA